MVSLAVMGDELACSPTWGGTRRAEPDCALRTFLALVENRRTGVVAADLVRVGVLLAATTMHAA